MSGPPASYSICEVLSVPNPEGERNKEKVRGGGWKGREGREEEGREGERKGGGEEEGGEGGGGGGGEGRKEGREKGRKERKKLQVSSEFKIHARKMHAGTI